MYKRQYFLRAESFYNVATKEIDYSDDDHPSKGYHQKSHGERDVYKRQVYMVIQLRHDEKILDERFASMRELHRQGKTPDPEHYEVTYYADLPTMWQDVPNNEILEELFQMFNLSRPQDFEGHSLSVSDVIALKRNGEVSVHYVDSIGDVYKRQALPFR